MKRAGTRNGVNEGNAFSTHPPDAIARPAVLCEASGAGQWGDAPLIHTFANNQETLDNG
jgi:hypothetical protein